MNGPDVQALASLTQDPLEFVLRAFRWGEGELEGMQGPAEWQRRVLTHIRDSLHNGHGHPRAINGAIRIARSSGHGIGKSTLVAWIVLWAMATCEDTRGVITANTKTQLETKTRAELAKWHRLFICSHMFDMAATSMISTDPAHTMTWRADFIPWSENNPEAFAGLHNKGKRLFVIFDEASWISDCIWETTEGALTDLNTEIVWCVFGNPTRNTGRFRECFGRFKALWNIEQIDARNVPFNTNRKLHDEWITTYGEDSDFVRIRVRGVFPRTGEQEFISSGAVEAAAAAEAIAHSHDPLVVGVDVARYGTNESVIWFRKGRDARSIEPIRMRGISTVELAGKVSEACNRYRVDAIFVDGGGVGGGVIDQLRALHVHCFDVQFGAKQQGTGWATGNQGEQYANKRAEMWGCMRQWLASGAIPDNQDLKAQLVGPTYTYNLRNEILLEKKEDMMKRGLDSPDLADALALTFALPVAAHANAGGEGPAKPLVETEWNPFSPERMAA